MAGTEVREVTDALVMAAIGMGLMFFVAVVAIVRK